VEGRVLLDSPEPLTLLPEYVRDLLLNGDPDQPALLRGESACGTARPTDEGLEILLFRSEGWKGEGGVLVEDLAAGVAGLDVKGVVRIWNRTMENLFHIPRDYAVGKRLEDLLRPPLLYSWDTVISRTLQGRQMKVECRPGQDRRVEARFSQTSSGAVGTFLDTTESYLTEKRLRTNRKMNQAYFQSISSGLVLFGSDFRILVSNRAFGKLFGASESLLGMPLYEVLPEESFRRIESASKDIFEGHDGAESDLGVVEYWRPDGSAAVMTQRIKPLMSEEGRVTYCVGILEDITPSVKAERNLQLCMERLEAGGRLVAASRLRSVGEVAESYAEALVGALAADATAVYLYDPYSKTNLAGSAGQWPQPPPQDFADLGLPSSVWTSEEGVLLREDEMGGGCAGLGCYLVVPVGEGSSTSGFLLAAYKEEAGGRDLFEMGRLAARLLYLRLQTLKERSERERLEYLVDRHGSFLASMAGELSIPFALFGGDMKVLAWNSAMADATGLSLEKATASPQNAVDTLFQPAGGLGQVRKWMGGANEADLPMIWSLDGDGDASRYAWKVALLESPVGVNVEQVMVVSGVPVKDGSLLEKANRACDAYRKLERAILRIFTAADDQVVADTLSETLVDMTEATRTRVELVTGAVSERASSGRSESGEEASELEIVWKKQSLGSCTVEGGTVSTQARELVSAAATALSSLSYRRLGRMLSHREAQTGHLFTDRQGHILSYLRERGGSISEILTDVPQQALEEVMELAARTGRGVHRSTGKGEERFLVARRITCSQAAEQVLHWAWADCAEEDGGAPGSSCADAVGSRLMSLLGKLSASLQSNLNAIARVLEKDDPVKSAVSSSIYEFGGMGRVIFYMSLFEAVKRKPRRPLSLEELADNLVKRAVRKGNRPPDINMGEGLPPAMGQRDALLDLVERLMMLSHARGVLSIHFDLLESRPEGDESVSSLGGGPLLAVTLGFGSDTPEPSGFADLLMEADSGFLSRATELGMLKMLMRLSGGDLVAHPDRGLVSLVLPAAEKG